MTQEAFYYQVQMQEEYEMSKMKDFVEQLREEMMTDEAFRELTEENQNKFIAEEMKLYEDLTK